VRRLRDHLTGPTPVDAPGVFDAVTALQASAQGFAALHLSGAIASATLLGLPDLGYVHSSELAALAARITAVTDVPLICDADTGYGSVLQVRRTVEAYAAAGVSGLHLEDQVSPKRCGHLAGKQVLPLVEAVAKVSAAVEAAKPSGMVVIARTDAWSVEGADAAVDRARAYAGAGADLVFVEGVRDAADLVSLHAGIPDVGLVLNQSEADPSMRPIDRATLAACGVRLVIHPVGAYLASARATAAAYESLARDHHTLPVAKLGWAELTDLLGQPSLLEIDAGYAQPSFPRPSTEDTA
jgi:methylisocitrate lyase